MHAVVLHPDNWIYLIGILALLGTMVFRANVVVPAVIATFCVAIAATGSILQGFLSIFNASLWAANQLFSIFLVIAFVTALLNALKTVNADVLMIAPFRKVMRGSLSGYIVLAVVTYLLSLCFWPTPAVPLVCAVLLPAAIAAGVPPLVGALVIAVAGQGMALSSDFIIRVAPGISAKAAGVGVTTAAVADNALILSLIVGIVALVLGYIFNRKSMKKPSEVWLKEWYATATSISTSEVSSTMSGVTKKEKMGSGISKEEIAEGSSRTEAQALEVETELENPKLVDERGHSRWGHIFAIITPLAFLIVVIVMVAPYFGHSHSAVVKGGDAAAFVGGVAFVVLMALTYATGGPRGMLEDTSKHMIDGLVFAFKAMGVVLPIAGFFFLGTKDGAVNILGMSQAQAPALLFQLIEAAQGAIPHSHIIASFGIMIVGMVTGLDGSGFAGLPLTGSLSGALGPVVGMKPAVLAALGQIGSVWSGGGTLIAWSSLIAVAGFSRVNVMDVVRLTLLPVCIGLACAAVFAGIFL
ncbi:MAG TPA: hypothetical protein VFQ88_03390 [Nevskiaceae bacterium]|nr:hypothetical protein [Nevskiaceae bacterium]